MRQNSKVESPTPSSPAIALHPVLSSALANLDMQLEDELVRYRRQRTVAGRIVRQPGRRQSPAQLDLIAVSAAQPAPALEERLADVAEPVAAPDAYKPIPAFTASPQPFEAAIALRKPEQPTHDGSGDKASLLSVATDNHALAQAANPDLDDYLESSEELLRSLADQQADVQAERSFMRSLLTPLGLGSMLLLLLSSAMFGYVIMNPSSLESLMTRRNPTASSTEQPPGAALPSLPPNPTDSELPVLDPKNLGVIDPRASSPASTPAAVTSTRKSAIATTNAAPNTSPDSQSNSETPSVPVQAPIPAVTSSSSRPTVQTAEPPQVAPQRSAPAQAPVATVRSAPVATTTSPAAVSSGSGAGSYQYKVGIPFENDQTLTDAKKVVPDAFVRTLPDGRTIVQVGAARDESEVRANVQRLRDQGLSSTEVYKR